jgi:ribosome recycling factor
MLDEVFLITEEKMEKTLAHYKEELKTVRTGRASTSMFEKITVDYYGAPTPLPQVATINVPEARLITISPFDPSMISDIEKAILSSGMGFNPSNDGKLIRIPVPQLTEERRKELVKLVKKMGEETKLAIRNERRSANDKIKKLEKNKEISEDDSKRAVVDIQELTDEYIKKVDELTELKEKDIMAI